MNALKNIIALAIILPSFIWSRRNYLIFVKAVLVRFGLVGERIVLEAVPRFYRENFEDLQVLKETRLHGVSDSVIPYKLPVLELSIENNIFESLTIRSLKRFGISFDLMPISGGTEIPAHGHYGVISSFLLLEGDVRAIHYHRIREKMLL